MNPKRRDYPRLAFCKRFHLVPVTGLGATHHKTLNTCLPGPVENALSIGSEHRGLEMAMRIEKRHRAMIDYRHDTRNPFGPRHLAPELKPR